jgi:hypothetical protein
MAPEGPKGGHYECFDDEDEYIDEAHGASV